MTVNQMVSGSSPEGRANREKPSAMMAFSLCIGGLENLHHYRIFITGCVQ
jgi:hypothetical protein